MKTCCLAFLRSTIAAVSALLLATAWNSVSQTGSFLPVVSIRAADPVAAEPGDPGLFTLFRDGPTNVSLYVYCVMAGSASNGVDYALIPIFIPIPAGIRSVPIPIRPIDDALAEPPETVTAHLLYPPFGMPETYHVGSPSNAVVTIYDNDGPQPTNRPPVVRITLPMDGAVFIAPVNIAIAAGAEDPDPDDYVATVEFFADNHTLGVRTNNPASASPVNPFMLVWSNVPAGFHVLTARATDSRGAANWSGPIHISVQDESPLPLVTIRAVDPNATEPSLLHARDPGLFVITRTGSTNDPMTVYYSIRGTASNGVDYAAIPHSVAIPAGRWSAEIVINPLPDALPEGIESVALRIEPPVCIAIFPPPPGCYQVGVPGEAVVFIADNQPPQNLPPGVRITHPLDGAMFVKPADVLIRTDAVDPDGYVDHIEFYDGLNQIGEETRYFFVAPPPGEHQIYEMIWTNPPVGRHVLTARARDNMLAESLSPPVTIWIVETNPPPTNFPPLVTIAASDPIAAEGTNCCRWPGWSDPPPTNYCGTNTASFVIRRYGPTNDSLTVDYRIGGTASNGVDYAALPGAATIPAGRRAVEFKIWPVDDLLPECLETVVLGLRAPPDTPSNVPPYLVGYPGRAAAIIVDNDQPRPGTGVLPDRCFHVMKPGPNGSWWRIECSHDMVHWTPVCTNMVTDGAIHFVDPDADDLPTRFYRAVPEPNPPTE